MLDYSAVDLTSDGLDEAMRERDDGGAVAAGPLLACDGDEVATDRAQAVLPDHG